MFCKYCGNTIDDDSTFCQRCGKRQHEAEDSCENFEQIESTPAKSPDAELDKAGDETQSSAETRLPKDLENDEQTTSRPKQETPVNSKIGRVPKESRRTIGVVVAAIVITVLLAIGILLSVLNNRPAKLSASDIAKLSSSVLTVYVYDKNHELIGTGSGFIVNDDKTMITNYHVIDQGFYVEVVSENDIHYNLSGVTYFDSDADLAVLRFESETGLKPLKISDSSSVSIGDTVYTIGCPLGLKNTVSNGIVSAFSEEGDIQITAPISEGSSGGALLNAKGEAIGITYASYSRGQNLNLAIPSNKFIGVFDDNNGVQPFKDVALFNAPLGNSIENYSSNGVYLVRYGDIVFESYNSNNEIISHNTKTKESKKLGISGTNLSVYHGVLYYVSAKNAIGTYDITTGEVCSNILHSYPSAAQANTIIKLYVTKYGLSVIYTTGIFKYALLQLDFYGNIIGRIDSVPSYIVVATEDTLVGSDYKNRKLVFISLRDLSQSAISVDFTPNNICATSEGYLLISIGYETRVKFDLLTGQYTPFYLDDASTLCCFVNGGEIYYPATYGTAKMSVLGSSSEPFNSTYELNFICFTDDGYMYAIGTLPGASIELEYTEYYIRVNLDGSQFEILDTEIVKY